MKYLKYETLAGSQKRKVLTLDIETAKLFNPDYFEWGSGERNRYRWSPYVCGIGTIDLDGTIVIKTGWCGSEKVLVQWIDSELESLRRCDFDECMYFSKNYFDEMVLKGRFINARRPLTKMPLKDASIITTSIKFSQFLNPDAKDRPNEKFDWTKGKSNLQFPEEVVSHCSRDIVENLLRLSRSDLPELSAFCENPFKIGALCIA